MLPKMKNLAEMRNYLNYVSLPAHVGVDSPGIKPQDMLPVFKLLIVEDSDNFRLILKELCKAHFCSVVIEEASSGEEALIKMQTFLPDIIFYGHRAAWEQWS